MMNSCRPCLIGSLAALLLWAGQAQAERPASKAASAAAISEAQACKEFQKTRARQPELANWIERWSRKLDKTAAANPPVDSRKQLLNGAVRIGAEIGKNGELLSSSILRSSGMAELDRAALRLLQQAAPFDALPANMIDDAGQPSTVLVMDRIWTFGKATPQ